MDEDLKQSLEKLTKLSEENHQMLKSIKRHFIWQKIVSVFYFIIIVGPIIWAIFYLPPLIKPLISQYQDLLGVNPTGQINLQDIQKSITPEMLNKLKMGQ
ncbi:MAG: hypothetical protein PHE24_05185 [Patescibacteria group bacterium]|nr:hypothetical protein [Patescibacteria group bacterium]